jgi:uncharacterized protein DUF5666/uncharacterized protein DUF4382
MAANGYVCAKVQVLLWSLLLGVVAVTTGCGSYSSSSMTAAAGAKSATQVRIGDAPSDRVVSFEISVGPVTMTPAGGSAVTVLSSPREIELAHLSETNEPLALLNVPQGSYGSMTLTVANPEVTSINNLGATVELQPAFNQSITINFSPALNVGTGSSVINIDLNLANSLTFDAQGNVAGVAITANSFSVSTSAVAPVQQQHAEDGELEDTTGLVTGVSGTSFTMTVGQNGVSLTFTTDVNTQFSDGASLATMLNTIVNVEGNTQPDGSLYAKEIEGVENNAGMEADGLVTQVSGNPATQLSVVAQDGSGSGMDTTKIGTTLSIDVSGANYKVEQGNIDTSGIGGLPSSPNFPFDATTIHTGQRVEIESSSSMSSSTTVADKVKLQQQTLTGTVSGLAAPTSAGPVTFTLTVAPDSAFAMLAGQSRIAVYWQPGTDLHNLASVSNGDIVRVRGLVFFTSSSFNMIAHRIGQ